MSLLQEVNRRRTFAVVSHPDAGKTTLTEKLLLFGGAIQVAGAVKSNKIDKDTMSDFMEIEKQRGISVATSVMGFEYEDNKINILDTPGHKDFAEDTYRTLTAADSVIIVVDVAKGVEEQTEKLAEVCRMRNTPIMVFINKMDREGKEAFDLLDEIEQKLKIKVRPLSWPVGMGRNFKGVYDLYQQRLNLFQPHGKQGEDETIAFQDLNDPELDQYIHPLTDELREEVELVENVYPPFDVEAYRQGQLSPVFFGSAVNNFGVKELFDCFLDIAPPPQESHTKERTVRPQEEKFSGFVFKIHANMDPKHRNRIAFVKVCSGIFERNKAYLHVRQNRKMKISSPTGFMAQKKETLEYAYPGDVIGIPDNGHFKIGDTLTEGEKVHFQGIPSFSPEQFRYIENADPMKAKQFAKGVDQLMDEGVAQLFTSTYNDRKIIGTVGELQFEVIQYRLKHEYGASCRFEPLDVYKAVWVTGDEDRLADLRKRKSQSMAKDKDGRDVFLAKSEWMLKVAQDDSPELSFHFSSEF